MSDVKFDPVTGKPITNQDNGGFKFDPMTGKPINQQPNNDVPKFDPMTGKPLGQADTEGPKFDPLTGRPISSGSAQNTYGAANTYGTQNTYGAQNTYGTTNTYNASGANSSYGYDPSAIEKEQSAQNKKVALVVLVVIIIAFIGLAIFGVVKATQYIKNTLPGDSTEITNEDPIVPAKEPDQVAEAPAQEPVEQPAEEPVEQPAEQPAEQPTEEPVDNSVEGPATQPASGPATQPDNSVNGQAATVNTDDIFAFSVSGHDYQVPMKVSVLLNDGWTFDTNTDATTMLGAGDKDYYYLICPFGDTSSISVDVKNFSMDAQQAKDCYITGITLYDNDVNKVGEITTKSGAVKLGTSTEDQVKSIYGEPDDIYDSSISHVYSYYLDGNMDNYDSRTSISFENGVCDYFAFRNEAEPSDLEQVEISSETPDYLSYYVAPSSLGADPFSGNFQVEGVVYNLPVPLQVMVDNGWKYDVEDEYAVGAGEGYVITIYKGDNYITATVFNYNEKATYLKNTIVTSVNTNADGHFGNNMQLPAGLYAGMSEADLLKWLNTNGITNYDYSSTTEIYKIPFDQSSDASYSANRYYIYIEDGVVDQIDITNYGWLRQ